MASRSSQRFAVVERRQREKNADEFDDRELYESEDLEDIATFVAEKAGALEVLPPEVEP